MFDRFERKRKVFWFVWWFIFVLSLIVLAGGSYLVYRVAAFFGIL